MRKVFDKEMEWKGARSGIERHLRKDGRKVVEKGRKVLEKGI